MFRHVFSIEKRYPSGTLVVVNRLCTHKTIVCTLWLRYVVVARRRCLQFDDKVNGIINKANGKRVSAASRAHLACYGHKRVEEIIRKGPSCLLLSPGSPNYNSAFVFVKASAG
ncbi:hypothetical protein PUN28_011989 [Cardiocondyla obscurior]|uniref:Uncharacterized protein n=1 Tax=Cardiocondyla obscurior TaxID=286306 RepID=A0AAW2F8T7_9HYME